MTDATHTTDPAHQTPPPKKNFFGGEINLNDPESFQPLDHNDPLDTNEPLNTNEPHTDTPVTHPQLDTNEPRTDALVARPQDDTLDNDEYDFTEFDPFGDDENDNLDDNDNNASTSNESHGDTPQPNDSRRDASLMRPNDMIPKRDTPTQHPNDEQPQNNDIVPPATASRTSYGKGVAWQDGGAITDIPNPISTPTDTVDTLPPATDEIISKFLDLSTTAQNIFQISTEQSHFQIIGGKNDHTTLEYFIYLVEDDENHRDLFIRKVEIDNATEEEDEHLLQRSYNTQTQHLNIFVDEIILYEIGETKLNDQKRKQIIEKLNKFWFLFETHYEDLNKAYLEQQEAQEKKKQLHEIFRNF